jgi:hypothetical protein
MLRQQVTLQLGRSGTAKGAPNSSKAHGNLVEL